MESVWVLLDGGPVDRFGFSWLVAFSLRKPPLGRVGFPWISLDSLVRNKTFQWVTRISREEFFSRLFPGVKRRQDVSVRSSHAEAQDCSWGQLTLFSAFLQ